MTKVLVVEHLISLQHAKRILMLFKKKGHKDAGYHFELTDLGVSIHHRSIAKKFPHLCDPDRDGLPRHYADYSGAIDGYHLKVYRTIS
jgi:hypothetical protein